MNTLIDVNTNETWYNHISILTRKKESMIASQERREAKVLFMLSLLYWNIRMQMMFPMNPNRDTNEMITPTIQNSTLEFNSDILFIFLKLVRHWKIQQHYLQYVITEFLVGLLFFTVSIAYNYPHCM